MAGRPDKKAQRNRPVAGKLATSVFCALLLLTTEAKAEQEIVTPWMVKDSDIIAIEAGIREYLVPGALDNPEVRYGRLLFNSPLIMGEKALRLSLSCNSCHIKGHQNDAFFISGLSDRPGHVDLSHDFWGAGRENNRFDPLPIPSLRGLKSTAPYGPDGSFNDIRAILHHVAEEEFAGPKLRLRQSRALVAYLRALSRTQRDAAGEDLSIQAKTSRADPGAARTDILLADALNLLISALFSGDATYIDKLVQLTRRLVGQKVRLLNNDDERARYHVFARSLSLRVQTSPDQAKADIKRFRAGGAQ